MLLSSATMLSPLYIDLPVTSNRKIEKSKNVSLFSSIAIASEIRIHVYTVNTNYTQIYQELSMMFTHVLFILISPDYPRHNQQWHKVQSKASNTTNMIIAQLYREARMTIHYNMNQETGCINNSSAKPLDFRARRMVQC